MCDVMRLIPRSERHDDDGFTLIELLIAIVIMGVITLPLGNLIIGYFQNTTQTTARLNESHDAQIAATYFAQDTASIGTRNATTQLLNQSVWQGNFSGAPYVCGAGTPVALFAWDEFTAGPSNPATVIEVAYVTQTVGTERQFRRVYCPGPAGTPTTAVLGHDLDPATALSVTCLVNGSTTACEGTGAAVPTTVQVTLNMKDPADSGSAYTVTLTGQRRQT
jgi:prepilin-type N-terminal cleavage/methylation domain-containing protein